MADEDTQKETIRKEKVRQRWKDLKYYYNKEKLEVEEMEKVSNDSAKKNTVVPTYTESIISK